MGRFGVGFAAVRSVADRVRVGAGDHAVELSLDRTRAALDDVVADRPDLAAEVAGRGDRLPVLRLPFPARVEVPPGCGTEVAVEQRAAAERQERRGGGRDSERAAAEGAGARGGVDVELDPPHALRAARVRVGADPEGAGRGGHALSLVLRAGGPALAHRRTTRAPGETTRQCAASYAVWISWEIRPRSLTV